MKDKRKIALLTTILYITIMGIGMTVMHFGIGYSYSDPEMVKVIIVAEIFMTLLTVLVTKKYFGWENVGFKKINPKGLLWFTPHILVIVCIVTFWLLKLSNVVSILSSTQSRLILLVCLTTMLVGFSEELMFRGIVLYAFKDKGSPLKAIIVSAVCFSALHSINVLGGSPVIVVIEQLGLTFIFGMCFAPLAIKIQNIWPLIIFHWLWDFTIVSGSIIGYNDNFLSLVGILLNIILAIVLWSSMKKNSNPVAK